MASLQKISLYLILLVILSLSSCTTLPWESWNNAIASNGGNPLTNTSFTIPTLPTNWKRNYGTGAINTTNTTRRNQYMNYLTNGSKTCKIYCGPRSFLLLDANNLLICKRDTSSSYWGGINDINNNTYAQYCIPNVQYSGSGSSTNNNACKNNNQNLFNMGSCNSGQNNIPYVYSSKNYTSCCYMNVYYNENSGAYTLLDEVDFTATTTQTNLLDSEFK